MGEDTTGHADGYLAVGRYGVDAYAYGHECGPCGGVCTRPRAHAEEHAAFLRRTYPQAAVRPFTFGGGPDGKATFIVHVHNPADSLYDEYVVPMSAPSLAELVTAAEAYVAAHGWQVRRYVFANRAIRVPVAAVAS